MTPKQMMRWAYLLAVVTAGICGPPLVEQPDLHDWPNVLAVQGTWLFDQGSNFGWSISHQVRYYSGGACAPVVSESV